MIDRKNKLYVLVATDVAWPVNAFFRWATELAGFGFETQFESSLQRVTLNECKVGRVVFSEHQKAQPRDVTCFRPPLNIASQPFKPLVAINIIGGSNSGKTSLLHWLNREMEGLGLNFSQPVEINYLQPEIDAVNANHPFEEFLKQLAPNSSIRFKLVHTKRVEVLEDYFP